MTGRSRLVFVLAAVVLAASAAIAAPKEDRVRQQLDALEKRTDGFSFVVIGDNRSGDKIYAKLISLAMERKPDFIVSTGDMVAAPRNSGQWTKFWELSRPVDVPYLLTPGNHDVHPKIPLSEKMYRKQAGYPAKELYYAFTVGNSLFIVLDTRLENQEKKITGDQFLWLEGVLANTTKRHKFVFLHHPLYTEPGEGRHAGDCLDKHPRDRDRLEALFVKAGVDAVFAGHEHLYRRRTVDGIRHIITGGGGAPLYAPESEGGFHHFIRMTVDGDAVRGEVIDSSGKTRDTF